MEECAEEGRVQEASTINKEVERLQGELEAIRDVSNLCSSEKDLN
jgi:hypothetical protein